MRLAITILLFPALVMAQSGESMEEKRQSSIEEAENLEDIGGMTTESGGRENAEKSQEDSGSTQMLGMIMGAMFMAMCGPQNPMACALAAMSFMDAAKAGGNKGNSNTFENALLPDGTINPDATEQAQAEAQLAALSEMGYTVNAEGGVSTPNGETLTPADFSSTAALQEKGFSSAQAQQGVDLLSKVSKDAEEKAGGAIGEKKKRSVASVSKAGAAAGSSGGTSTEYVDDPETGSAIAGVDKKKDRLPAEALAKLRKNFNGTPIGIGSANIFLIVKQKYSEKNKKSEFINKEF